MFTAIKRHTSCDSWGRLCSYSAMWRHVYRYTRTDVSLETELHDVTYLKPVILNLWVLCCPSIKWEQNIRIILADLNSVSPKTREPNGFQARSQNCEKRLLPWSCLSVRPFTRPSAWNNSGPKGLIFMKFVIWVFFPKSVEKSQVSLTIWRLTTYIYMSYRTADLQTLHFKYLLNKYTYWIF